MKISEYNKNIEKMTAERDLAIKGFLDNLCRDIETHPMPEVHPIPCASMEVGCITVNSKVVETLKNMDAKTYIPKAQSNAVKTFLEARKDNLEAALHMILTQKEVQLPSNTRVIINPQTLKIIARHTAII